MRQLLFVAAILIALGHASKVEARAVAFLKLNAKMQSSTKLAYEIVNVSGTPRRIGVMSCSVWDNWRIEGDSAALVWDEPRGCDKNVCTTRELKPNESVTGALAVKSNAGQLVRSTFRLVFKSCDARPKVGIELRSPPIR